MNKRFDVNGMTCSACEANVKRTVSKLNGVNSVNVSLLGKSMNVDYDDSIIKENAIIEAVNASGYSCSLYVNRTLKQIEADRKNALKKTFTKVIVSFVLLICLMVFSMGPMIFGYPKMDDPNYGLIMIIDISIQFAFLIPIIILNFSHFSSGYKSLIKLHPNMDSLVALGSTVSILYGIYSFVLVIVGQVNHNHELLMNNAMNIYIESGAMIPVIVGLGKFLEAKATSKTSSAIASLIELLPDVATVRRNNKIFEIKTEDLVVGDIVIVKPGQAIPCDGIIVDGNSHVDESSLTGESKLIKKTVGDKVIGSTTNKEGSFEFKATSIGNDTVMSQIIELVKQASQSKAPISRLTDRISLFFVPTVIGLSLITFIIWVSLGFGGVLTDVNNPLDLAFQLAVSVLVISCPCALGLATPVSIMVGTGKGAENGVLIRSAEAFERLNKVDTVIFDKTGTLTKGEMSVAKIVSFNTDEKQIIETACELEEKSEHPLSKAIISYGKRQGIISSSKLNCNFASGKGITSSSCSIGNVSLMNDRGVDISFAKEEATNLSSNGYTVLFVEKELVLIGLIAVGDILKDDSVEAIQELKKMGKHVAMLTGDNEISAKYFASQLGIDEVFANVLPNEKEEVVDRLQKQGRSVLMVGDGVNDAPSLAKADIGVSIGSGTDVAKNSSDIILMNDLVNDVPFAINLSKKVVKTIKENLLWAFMYNVILIPLAAGVLYWVKVNPNWFTGSKQHLVLTPMIASLAMSFSSITVVLNALRIKLFKK